MGSARATIGGIEGSLRIQVEVDSGVVSNVRLRSQRPVNSGTLLEDRPVQDALDLLPRIFSLCGVAQTAAGLAAVENAKEVSLTPPQIAARNIMVAAEALEQTVWRIIVDWPTCLDIQPDVAGIRDLRRLLRSLEGCMFKTARWNRIGGSQLAPEPIKLAEIIDSVALEATRIIFGDSDTRLADYACLERWLRQGGQLGSSVLHYVRNNGLEEFGSCAVEQLPKRPDSGFLAQQLANDADWSFCAQPHYHGNIFETGPLSRLADHPLVLELRGRHGNGLLTRLAARLVDANELVANMRSWVDELCEDRGATANGVDGCGINVIDTTRGVLVHWVEIADDTVKRYRILAPTEWNFHPRGPLTQGLRGADAWAGEALVKNAGLLISALDPCVAYELDIVEH